MLTANSSMSVLQNHFFHSDVPGVTPPVVHKHRQSPSFPLTALPTHIHPSISQFTSNIHQEEVSLLVQNGSLPSVDIVYKREGEVRSVKQGSLQRTQSNATCHCSVRWTTSGPCWVRSVLTWSVLTRSVLTRSVPHSLGWSCVVPNQNSLMGRM